MSTYGYGVSIRNVKADKRNTVARQQLEAVGLRGQMVIDMVRNHDPRRPELEKLLDTLGEKDTLVLYSIETLLQGDVSNAVSYYSRMVLSKAKLLVYDFTGDICKYSEFSTCDFDGEPVVRSYHEKIQLIGRFADLVEAVGHNAPPGRATVKIGAKKGEPRIHFSDAFREIYFAYETYQIDQKTTLALLRDYCGVRTKITFWEMAKDYERSVGYVEDVRKYCQTTPDFMQLPSRFGGVREDCLRIEEALGQGLYGDDDMVIMRKLRMMPSQEVLMHWRWRYFELPVPRKPLENGFKPDVFRRKYRKVKQELEAKESTGM